MGKFWKVATYMAKKLNREQEQILKEMFKAEVPASWPLAGLYWSDVPASGKAEPPAQLDLRVFLDDEHTPPGRS